MKRELLITLLLIALISGCVILDQEPIAHESHPEILYNCYIPHDDLDWEKVISSSHSGNINQISNSELMDLYSEIRYATQNWDDIITTPYTGYCKNPPDKCKEYYCKILEAIRKNNNSICDELPDKIQIVINCTNNKSEIRKRIGGLFGLNSSDFNIDKFECTNGRGRYIKAKGTFNDGRIFEVYYKSGWCSSGGSDCGFDACFSINSEDSDEKFKIVQNEICNKLSSRSYKDTCLSGKFNQKEGEKTVLSVRQFSNRYLSNVKIGDIKCYGADKLVYMKDKCKAEVAYSIFQTENETACEVFENKNITGRNKKILKTGCYTHKAIRNDDIGYCQKRVNPDWSQCIDGFNNRFNQ